MVSPSNLDTEYSIFYLKGINNLKWGHILIEHLGILIYYWISQKILINKQINKFVRGHSIQNYM